MVGIVSAKQGSDLGFQCPGWTGICVPMTQVSVGGNTVTAMPGTVSSRGEGWDMPSQSLMYTSLHS
jgi:hypothetical protein